MAIIVCPNCGEKVTNRMEKCPHCHSGLIKQAEQPAVTKKMIEASAKDGVAGVATATVLTIALVLVWSAIAISYVDQIMGVEAETAVRLARMIFLFSNLITLIVTAVLLCIIMVFINKKPAVLFVSVLVITVLSGVAGYIIQIFGVVRVRIAYSFDPRLFEYTGTLTPGFGIAFPIVLGSLSAVSYNRTFKKILVMQGILSAIFIAVSVILGVPMMYNLDMGTNALSVAILFAGISVFLIAAVTNIISLKFG